MCLSGYGIGTWSNTVRETSNTSSCVLRLGEQPSPFCTYYVALRLELVVGYHAEQMGRGGSVLSFAACREMTV